MAKERNPQRQPSSLERLWLSRQSKGWRKKKEEKPKIKPKTRTHEFEFGYHWWGEEDTPEIRIRPGDAFQWGRRMGKSVPFKIMEDGRIMAISEPVREDTMVSIVLHKLNMKYPGVEISRLADVPSDNTIFHFRKRGVPGNKTWKVMSNTFMATASTDRLFRELEEKIQQFFENPGKRGEELPMPQEYFDAGKLKERADKQINSPVETWAEKWARENS